MSKNFNEEEYLKKHLQDIDSKTQTQPISTYQEKNQLSDATTISSLKYFSFDVVEFPCGIFYPAGTTIQIRPAEVIEIQSYSMIDDTNYYDIVEKTNEMLSSCVRIKYPDGRVSSYIDLRDPDRFYTILIIRELTFQQGNTLAINATCTCKANVQIELVRKNIRNRQIDEKIRKYYNPSFGCFTFNTKNGGVFNLAPPKIGLQRSFTDYIIKENAEKRKANMSFLKIIPFTLYNSNVITIDEINKKLELFGKLSNPDFQFLNSAVDKMNFGPEKVSKICDSCGLEVHGEFTFPNGPSDIFIIHDAFEKFIEE